MYQVFIFIGPMRRGCSIFIRMRIDNTKATFPVSLTFYYEEVCAYQQEKGQQQEGLAAAETMNPVEGENVLRSNLEDLSEKV